MRIEHELVIDASVDAVWRLTEDIEAWPALSGNFTSVERVDDGPLRPGTEARVKQPGQPARTWTVTVVDTPVEFAWETTMLGCRMVATHRLTPMGDQCRNTLVVELSGRGAGLWGRLLGRRIRAAIAEENEGLKAHAEGNRA